MRLLVCLISTLAFMGAERAHALRCGTHLIDTGDAMARVRALCGEPVDVAVRVDQRSVHQAVQAGVVVSNTISAVIESWTLNFGPQRFMVRIEFVDGLVSDIETLGRGFPPEQLGTRAHDVRLGQSPSRVRATWGEPAEQSRRVVQNAVTAFRSRVSCRRRRPPPRWRSGSTTSDRDASCDA